MTIELTVTGMTCGHCEKAVTRAIQNLDPQAQIQIQRQQNLVKVDTSAERTAVVAAIEEEGYQVASTQ
jgi:copper chaperone